MQEVAEKVAAQPLKCRAEAHRQAAVYTENYFALCYAAQNSAEVWRQRNWEIVERMMQAWHALKHLADCVLVSSQLNVDCIALLKFSTLHNFRSNKIPATTMSTTAWRSKAASERHRALSWLNVVRAHWWGVKKFFAAMRKLYMFFIFWHKADSQHIRI